MACRVEFELWFNVALLVGDESAAHDFIGPNLREISIKCP